MKQKPLQEKGRSCAQDIVDTVRLPLVVLDSALRVQSANHAFYRTFQTSPEETQDRLISELGNGQWDEPGLQFLLQKVASRGQAFNDFQVEHDFPSLGVRVVRLDARKLPRSEEGVLVLLGIEDVTERHRVMAGLDRTHLAFQQMMDNSLDIICTFDAEGRFLQVNQACELVLGYRPEELIGRRFVEMVHPDDRQKTLNADKTVLSGTSASHFENRYLRRDGSIVPILWSANWSEELQINVCIARDMTTQKQMDLKILTEKENAEAASKAKSESLASMSHDLRTPLNAILGYSEILQEEVAKQKIAGEFSADIGEIRKAGKHLLGLIDNLLDWSKVEAGKEDLFLESFDLVRMIDEVVSVSRHQGGKNANTLNVERSPDLGLMKADEAKVRQCLFNLLSNACKFTQKGKIDLKVTRQTIRGCDSVAFQVTDTGIGMSLEQMGKLFVDFSQADVAITRKCGAAGLGLVLTRRYCELMGGEVTVRSSLKQGSVFTITLPTHVREPRSGTAVENDESFIASGKEGTGTHPTPNALKTKHDSRLQ